MSGSHQRSVSELSLWAARLFARALERRLAPTRIATAYIPVLFALEDGGEMTQKALAQHAMVEQPTMAATLKRMIRDGLVRRQPDPTDRRSAYLSLTPRARAQLPEVRVAIAHVNDLSMAALQPQERETLLWQLLQMIAALEADEAAAGRNVPATGPRP